MVHPRARGEHACARSPARTARGSSPRTRGTLNQPAVLLDQFRFIPAHAGNTEAPRGGASVGRGSSPRTRGTPGSSIFIFSIFAVHPRARGEHARSASSPFFGAGSSPRTRGTHHQTTHGLGDGRFIPAHAGNTVVYLWPDNVVAVHPRARGEHFFLAYSAILVDGSSPRTRGTHLKFSHVFK